jgi:hypothetical protein
MLQFLVAHSECECRVECLKCRYDQASIELSANQLPSEQGELQMHASVSAVIWVYSIPALSSITLDDIKEILP